MGAGAFPSEAAISTTDTEKPLCIEYPTQHIKQPKSEEDQYQHLNDQLQCLHQMVAL